MAIPHSKESKPDQSLVKNSLKPNKLPEIHFLAPANTFKLDQTNREFSLCGIEARQLVY